MTAIPATEWTQTWPCDSAHEAVVALGHILDVRHGGDCAAAMATAAVTSRSLGISSTSISVCGNLARIWLDTYDILVMSNWSEPGCMFYFPPAKACLLLYSTESTSPPPAIPYFPTQFIVYSAAAGLHMPVGQPPVLSVLPGENESSFGSQEQTAMMDACCDRVGFSKTGCFGRRIGDPDIVFGYNTPSIVKVRDKRLGITYLCL